uniref:U1-type domain-containing protein n=1 Tax=Callorhinchus milii TaxID=7868 RepID=A0A4W3KAN8_CALMI
MRYCRGLAVTSVGAWRKLGAHIHHALWPPTTPPSLFCDRIGREATTQPVQWTRGSAMHMSMRAQLTPSAQTSHSALCGLGELMTISPRRSPDYPPKSAIDRSLRITVGNDRYCSISPDRRHPSVLDRLGSPVDALYDAARDEMADGPIYTNPMQQSTHMQTMYPSRDQAQGSQYTSRPREDYRGMPPPGDSFRRRPDYGSHYSSEREDGRRSSEPDLDKLKKASYSHSRCDDRSRELDRGRDTKRANSHAQDHFSYGKDVSKNNEFRELEIARRRKEQEERIKAEMLPTPRYELSNSYGLPEHYDKGLMGVTQSSDSGYVLHRPDEAPPMPKKSILKKRTETGFEPSATMQESYLPSQNYMRLPQHEPSFPKIEPFSYTQDSREREIHHVAEQGILPCLTNTNFSYERSLVAKYCGKSEIELGPENVDRVSDFFLPHERATQDAGGFSRVLGLLTEAENCSLQERRKRSFPDIEDEEKFLYGEDEDEKTEPVKYKKAEAPEFKPVPANRNVLPIRQSSLPAGASTAASVKPDEEYEKIHDLLKTIGLDIGVSEISKLAARTQERLHGKKPSTRSPDRTSEAQKTSSSNKRRTRSETKSSEPHPRPVGKSFTPEISGPYSRVMETKEESFQHEIIVTPSEPERMTPQASAVSSSLRRPPLLRTPAPGSCIVPPFGQYPIRVINYPPTAPLPNFNQYGRYMSCPATTAWPMFPPPMLAEPYVQEPISPVILAQQPKVARPNLRVIETTDGKREGSVLVQVPTTDTIPTVSSNRTVLMPKSSSRQQLVCFGFSRLKENTRSQKVEMNLYLKGEIRELLRRKRREKDGHKDPLLVENGKLQEDITRQMAVVRQQAEETAKKLSELDKVAQILGALIHIKTQPNISVRSKEDSEEILSQKAEKSPSSKVVTLELFFKLYSLLKQYSNTEGPKEEASKSGDVYEYYDAGNHWCKHCNMICGTLFDFFTHMHNKRHRQTLDPYDRPWATKQPNEDKNDSVKRTEKITLPAKGSEFLMPVTGFYCQLCQQFYGDQICGEDHVKSHGHNDKYKEFLEENPVYEQRRNLDRQAGLAVIMETDRRRQAGLKRKIDEEKEAQKQKKQEESEEKNAKLIKMDREERENVTELEEERSDHASISTRKIECGHKTGIKLMLKKDEPEEKKEDEHTCSASSCFGKFSWKRNEKEEEKSSTLAGMKEENGESSKEKDDGKTQSGKSISKTIEIKLSGKTLIAHTSPWVPFSSVTTITQAKIRPNLPVASMPLRKPSVTSVNKPAPLDTFLSIRSSGTSNKPLPVVKAETKTEVLLAPEVISKAFGGEEVTLEGSVLDINKEIYPSTEEPAPGVSEFEQPMLAVPIRPPPPPVTSGDSSKKAEKPKTCLAAANAKDLYGIFYGSSGKGPTDSKLGLGEQSARLGHSKNIDNANLKPAGQVKSVDGNSAKEQVYCENITLVVSKTVVSEKGNKSLGDQAEDTQTNQQTEPDSDLSTSTSALQDEHQEVNVFQKNSKTGSWKATAAQQQSESSNLILNPTVKPRNEEIETPILERATVPLQCKDDMGISSPVEATDLEEDAFIVDSTTTHLNITSTDEKIEVLVSDSIEKLEQCIELNISKPVEVVDEKNILESNRTAELEQCDELSISKPFEEVRDVKVDAPILDSTAEQSHHCDDDLKTSYLADQVGDKEVDVSVLVSTSEQVRLCNKIPGPVDEFGNVDGRLLDSTVEQQRCDINFSIFDPLEDIGNVKMDVPVLGGAVEQSYETSLSIPSPVEEVSDVQVDTSLLPSTANEQCDDLSIPSLLEDVKDGHLLVSAAEQQCNLGLSIPSAVEEVRDIQVDVPVLSSNAELQCDLGLSIPNPIEEVRDVQVDILDSNIDQLDWCDNELSIPNPVEEVHNEKLDTHKLGTQAGTNLLQTERHVSGHLSTELSSSQQTKAYAISAMGAPIIEEHDTYMSSSVQKQPCGISVVITPDAGQGGSGESKAMSGSSKMNTSKQTKQCGDCETLKPAAQVAELEQLVLLESIKLSALEPRVQKESSEPSSLQPAVAAGTSEVSLLEKCKNTSDLRTSSRRAAQAAKGALQASNKSNEKRESEDNPKAEPEAPTKQLRRRSARNLQSPK